MFRHLLIYPIVALWLATGVPACQKCSADKRAEPPSANGKTVECPVCGLRFNDNESIGVETFQGKTYYFYLEDHRQAFKSAPEIYVDNTPSPSTPTPNPD
jgi:YHS domain-containing protein